MNAPFRTPAEQSAYTFATAESADAALTNIERGLDAFLKAHGEDLKAVATVGDFRPDQALEVAALREAITEYLRDQYGAAFRAAEDHFEYPAFSERSARFEREAG